MDLQLKKYRKLAGFKKQKDAAQALGIPERRYASWERGEAMLNLEQAYACAVLFGCTLDELAGAPTQEKVPAVFGKIAQLPMEDREDVEDFIEYKLNKKSSEAGHNNSVSGVA